MSERIFECGSCWALIAATDGDNEQLCNNSLSSYCRPSTILWLSSHYFGGPKSPFIIIESSIWHQNQNVEFGIYNVVGEGRYVGVFHRYYILNGVIWDAVIYDISNL